jgi:hypothetical protein
MIAIPAVRPIPSSLSMSNLLNQREAVSFEIPIACLIELDLEASVWRKLLMLIRFLRNTFVCARHATASRESRNVRPIRSKSLFRKISRRARREGESPM